MGWNRGFRKIMDKFWLEVIGFLGAAFEVLGVYLLGNKVKYGFYS